MKVTVLLVALLLLVQCADRTATQEIRVSSSTPSATASPTPGISIEVSNVAPLSEDESRKVDEEKEKEIERLQEKEGKVPDDFKKVDFKNFSYPFGKLREGTFERDYPVSGGETYRFVDVYYIDLAGDPKKEAMVEINEVSCGGSCDGGRVLFYFYSVGKRKFNLIGIINTGSTAYGCSLKSFRIENKSIFVEQYGRCQKSDRGSSRDYPKFRMADLTKSVYAFDGEKLLRRSVEFKPSPEVDVRTGKLEFLVPGY